MEEQHCSNYKAEYGLSSRFYSLYTEINTILYYYTIYTHTHTHTHTHRKTNTNILTSICPLAHTYTCDVSIKRDPSALSPPPPPFSTNQFLYFGGDTLIPTRSLHHNGSYLFGRLYARLCIITYLLYLLTYCPLCLLACRAAMQRRSSTLVGSGLFSGHLPMSGSYISFLHILCDARWSWVVLSFFYLQVSSEGLLLRCCLALFVYYGSIQFSCPSSCYQFTSDPFKDIV